MENLMCWAAGWRCFCGPTIWFLLVELCGLATERPYLEKEDSSFRRPISLGINLYLYLMAMVGGMELQATPSILQSLNLCLANGLGVDALWLRLCLPATGPGVDFALKLIRVSATQTRLTRPQVPSSIPGTLEAQCLQGAYVIGLDP
ncbi:hypothetical protein NC652_020678 [Populus alba x Populus x berolinensis]|nr:hypothetical protein NC652_020678 [Populus alba x Populus x berolinensis]